MVNVWAADITPLLIEEIYRAYYNRVPKWRKEKADKLRNVADRARVSVHGSYGRRYKR